MKLASLTDCSREPSDGALSRLAEREVFGRRGWTIRRAPRAMVFALATVSRERANLFAQPRLEVAELTLSAPQFVSGVRQ
jgi:hypothetical protein